MRDLGGLEKAEIGVEYLGIGPPFGPLSGVPGDGRSPGGAIPLPHGAQ